MTEVIDYTRSRSLSLRDNQRETSMPEFVRGGWSALNRFHVW